MSDLQIKPYKDSEKGKKEQVETMFDNISKKYDFLNRVITFGMDKKWRANVLKLVADNKPKSILDIATGTGDMAILFAKTDAEKIVGIDISQGMLEIADKKVNALGLENRIKVEVQNSEEMDFEDRSFDAISVTYGIRNFENLEKGLTEIYRVLNNGGVFVILETSQPKNKIIKFGNSIYTKYVMPFIARLFSEDKNAYQYLSTSAMHFPYGEKLKNIIQNIGFKEVEMYPQFFGVSTIYCAKK